MPPSLIAVPRWAQRLLVGLAVALLGVAGPLVAAEIIQHGKQISTLETQRVGDAENLQDISEKIDYLTNIVIERLPAPEKGKRGGR